MLRNTMRYRVRPASVDGAARRESAVNKATNSVDGRGKKGGKMGGAEHLDRQISELRLRFAGEK